MNSLILVFWLTLILVGDYLSQYLGIGLGLGVLSTFVVGLFCCVKLSRRFVIRKIDILLVASVVILLMMSQIARMKYPTEYNIAYAKDFIIYFIYVFIVLRMMRTRSFLVAKSIDLFAIFILALAFLQWTYITFGLGISPSNYVGFMDTGSDIYIYGIRSIFFNPNNFSAVCVTLTILYCLNSDLNELKRLMFLVALSTFTLIAGSRACAIAEILVLAVYSRNSITKGTRLRRLSYMKVFSIICVSLTLIAIIKIGSSSENSKSYWSEKIDNIPNLINTLLVNGAVHDHSINERLGVYHEYIDHFTELGFGGLHAQNYGSVITVNALMARNPHSLFVELSLLYGYPGLLAFLLLFSWLYLTVSRILCSRIQTALIIIALLLVTFVPSSMINVPQLWILYFVIGCLSMKLNADSRQSKNELDDLYGDYYGSR